MDVECIIRDDRMGIRIIPETDFEVDFISVCFVGIEDRKVIVKSGMSIGDVQSLDVFTEINNEQKS
jgi:hypothetical protein